LEPPGLPNRQRAMKRFVLFGLLLTLTVSGAVGLVVLLDSDKPECRAVHRSLDGSSKDVCADGTRFEGGVPSSNVPLSPQPESTPTTSEFRSEKVGKYRYRVWPRSADVPNVGAYRFSVPHCGLEWMTDFDGSFWKIIDRKSYGENGPSFFINSDQGTLTFEDDDAVVYRPSRGQEIRLRRLPGPTVIHLCE